MAFFEVKDVYKNFGANRVLKGIDLQLDEGQVLAIIGSSGSGKTTLLRCINFLEIPDKADIYLSGENIFSVDNLDEINKALQDLDKSQTQISAADIAKEDSQADLTNSKENGSDIVDTTDKKQQKQKSKPVNISKEKKKQIAEQRLKFGMVFQSFNLFPHYSVQKNLTLAAKLKYDKSIKSIDKYFSKTVRLARKQAFKEIDERAVALLQRVGLGEKLKAYTCELSGGQRQLVMMVRAFLQNPSLILMDEATANLDVLTEQQIQQVLPSFLAHKGAVIVAHRLSTIKQMDRIIVLDQGKIVASGTHEQLLVQSSLYQQLILEAQN